MKSRERVRLELKRWLERFQPMMLNARVARLRTAMAATEFHAGPGRLILKLAGESRVRLIGSATVTFAVQRLNPMLRGMAHRRANEGW